ncbi:MAG: TIGR04222 domain-containing membrane protein [Acidobacteria bacterium]|nr:TIGR04222 domain-containing membrane protein [Acidobacteriota bacterium]
MDILFDNPIGSMYGPYFLALYAVFIVFTLVVVWIMKKLADSTDKLPMPPISNQVDPYQIAYLRGGTNELARSVLFNLLQKGFLENSDAKTLKRMDPSPDTSRLNSIETVSIEWVGNGRSNNDIFGAGGLTAQLEGFGRTYEDQLEKQQLLTDDQIRTKVTVVKWLSAFAIAAFGLYKILAAFSKGRSNVTFLVVLGSLGIFAVVASGKLPRISKLGKAYLARLQLTFENLKVHPEPPPATLHSQGTESQTAFGSIDPFLLSIGVFGGAALGGSVYETYNTIFQKSQTINSSSCGAGCGDCGSSCSSSSCSSCSSCGGGCSGCGGCS